MIPVPVLVAVAVAVVGILVLGAAASGGSRSWRAALSSPRPLNLVVVAVTVRATGLRRRRQIPLLTQMPRLHRPAEVWQTNNSIPRRRRGGSDRGAMGAIPEEARAAAVMLVEEACRSLLVVAVDTTVEAVRATTATVAVDDRPVVGETIAEIATTATAATTEIGETETETETMIAPGIEERTRIGGRGRRETKGGTAGIGKPTTAGGIGRGGGPAGPGRPTRGGRRIGIEIEIVTGTGLEMIGVVAVEAGAVSVAADVVMMATAVAVEAAAEIGVAEGAVVLNGAEIAARVVAEGSERTAIGAAVMTVAMPRRVLHTG